MSKILKEPKKFHMSILQHDTFTNYFWKINNLGQTITISDIQMNKEICLFIYFFALQIQKPKLEKVMLQIQNVHLSLIWHQK